MNSDNLTKEQLAFLEECNLEFSERYTDSDLEYKKIYDLGIPTPPIICPWYGKGRFNNRDRGGRYNNYRGTNQYFRNEGNHDNRDRGYREGYREQAGSSRNDYSHRDRSNQNFEENRGRDRDSGQRNYYKPY